MASEEDDDFDGQNDPERRDMDALDKIKELQELPDEEILKRARKAQLIDLLAKLELGQLSHQEHAVLRNLIRDNGLNLTPFPPPDDANGQADTQATTPSKPKPPSPLPALTDPDYEQ